MKHSKILIADDEEYIRKLLTVTLENERMHVYPTSNGSEALKLVTQESFDLIILDIMMEDIDGYEVIHKIRSQGIQTPIFLLSGKNEDHDKIAGFITGADAYITKPFSPAVLCAEVKTHIKRYRELQSVKELSVIIQRHPFIFNLKTYTLSKDNTPLLLSSKETSLMKFFMEHPNQVFTKEQLYQNVWNDTVVDDNTIMVYIRRLRTKIEDQPTKPNYIQTVWGIGYKFTVDN